mmetsp:Transcript_38483/g.89474  ORF Transcript_38483/g.89474 Transcript_38483/m.89474 type:complete len:135 (+) Transcript_38483:212-616(+)
MIMNPENIRKEMLRNLMEWGVETNGKSKRHRKFSNDALRLAVDYTTSDCGLASGGNDEPVALPESPIHAIEKVLKTELESEKEHKTYRDLTRNAYGVEFSDGRPFKVYENYGKKTHRRSVPIQRHKNRGPGSSE